MHQGNIITAAHTSISAALNGEGAFIEFENFKGEQQFMSKASISQITPTSLPMLKKLYVKSRSTDRFDPFEVLNIDSNSDAAEIRSAYHHQAKLYHPDRFSGVTLPSEMAEYAENMTCLINSAYEVLQTKSVA